MHYFADIGLGRFYQGDCLEVMKELPDNCVDLVLCDLPYGTTACKWDSILQFESLWHHYERLITPSASIVLTASQPFTSMLITSKINLYKYNWVWEKNRIGGFWDCKFRPLKAHEDVCVFSKAGSANGSSIPMIYNPQGLQPGKGKWTNKPISGNSRTGSRKESNRTASNYPRSVLAIESETKPVHPTQKPIALMEYMIRTYSHEGMLVLDNCAGSGTTAIACENTNRRWVCIEKDPEYAEAAVRRIASHCQLAEQHAS